MPGQRQATCAERVEAEWQSTRDDLEKLLELWRQDPEASDDELGRLDEYGLAFDYVEPGTFTDQEHGYWRYQISYGGPSDEVRIYLSDGGRPYRAEYWFLDWFDGARVDVLEDPVFQSLFDYLEPAVEARG